MNQVGTRKALRELKRKKKALQYAIANRQGGGARETERRAVGGFFNTHKVKPDGDTDRS